MTIAQSPADAAATVIDIAEPPGARVATHAFFFDVDGTLLELKPKPGDVVADAELRTLLVSLFEATQGALALVSGRAIADLDRIFAPLRLPAAGLHGSDVRYADGSGRTPDPHLMDRARPEIAQYVGSHDGLMLEDKGATLAVHYRERPELGASVLQFMRTFGPNDAIAVQEGKMVVELRPAAIDKGTAIAAFLARAPFAGRLPVFYGDDLTDEAGFDAVNAVGGISTRIGARETPTRARFHLADPAAVRRELQALVAAARPSGP